MQQAFKLRTRILPAMGLAGVMLLRVVVLICSCSESWAFVSPTTSTRTPSCNGGLRSICSRTKAYKHVSLFATKKKRKPKAESKGANTGGGGFGKAATTTGTSSSRNTKEQQKAMPRPLPSRPILLSAAELARLNTFHTKQRHQFHEQLPDSLESDSSEEEESSRLKALYTQQYLAQKLAMGPTTKKQTTRQLTQVSTSPLIFTVDNFIDPAACKRVQDNAAGCFDLMFPETVSDLLFGGQECEMDGLLFNKADSREHSAISITDQPHYPDGLHMDTNNKCMFRHVTCLLYLNDIPEECGGATVFPLARCLPKDPALQAARRLLDYNLSHTRSREIVSLGLQEEARLLEARHGTNFPKQPTTDTAISIQPQAGKLLVFFSRDSQGREDPRTWHAGARIHHHNAPTSSSKTGVASVTTKRILTLFKEVDCATTTAESTTTNPHPRSNPQHTACTLEDYLAPQTADQRDLLQAKVKLQNALLTSYLPES